MVDAGLAGFLPAPGGVSMDPAQRNRLAPVVGPTKAGAKKKTSVSTMFNGMPPSRANKNIQLV